MNRAELIEASEETNKEMSAAKTAFKAEPNDETRRAWYSAIDAHKIAQHAAAAAAPRSKAPSGRGRDNQAGRRQWAIMDAEQTERKRAAAMRARFKR